MSKKVEEEKTPKKTTLKVSVEQLKKLLSELKMEFAEIQMEYKKKIISLTKQINKKVEGGEL